MRSIALGAVLTAGLALAGCQGSSDQAAAAAADSPPQITGAPGRVAVVGSMYQFQPSASDPDGDPLIFGIDARPAWASFDTATGRLSGTPRSSDVGMARGIVVWVSDGSTETQLPTFDISVQASAVNRAPTISGSPSGAIAAGRPYDFTPAASDPDGDPLVFSVRGIPGWATFDAATGRLFGTPGAANVGSYPNIVLTVSDGQSTASLPAFSITVTPAGSNSAPSISGAAPTGVTAGSLYSFTPSASDADGDPLTFAIVGKPSWAAFSPTTGRLSGTPGAGNVGSYPGIGISVSDGLASTSLAPFTITVTAQTTNTAPVISGTPPTSATVAVQYSFTPSASDADGDTLSFSITNQPSWATFSTTTGRLRGTPSASDAGNTTTGIVIRVSDGQAQASLPTFAITVSAPPNSPPTISGTPPASVNVGSAYNFQPSASDPDGDTLTFSIANAPPWASFSTTTGRLQGTPAAGDVNVYPNIVITVDDGQAQASLAPFSITVNAVALGSATLSWVPPTQNDDGSTLTDLAGYRIYWGTSSGNYSDSVTIANPGISSYVIDNLSPGTYFFVATAYNSTGAQSDFSNEASKTIAP